jgi:hypothetical protein
MKRFLVLSLAALSFLTVSALGAQTAVARLFCLSLQFKTGHDESGLHSLELSTIDAGINGELAPDFNPFASFSHITFFELHDPTGLDPIPGALSVDVPFDADVNDNGFPDFFEVSQGVFSVTSGIFNSPGGRGTVQLAWSRAVGSKTGTCVLQLNLTGTGSLGRFTHEFDLLEYAGLAAYTPGTNAVSGTLDLMQSGDPGSTLKGPFMFTKGTGTNRFDELVFQPSVWTNSMMQRLVSFTNDFLRESIYPTNYFGYTDFVDGDLTTPEVDYPTWFLSIDDLNDADGDGIPDFSDDPRSTGQPSPSLTLKLGTTNLFFSVSGAVVQLHELQQATSLAAPDWQTVSSVTLASDPEIITLPLPSGGAAFWRVRAP